MIQKILQGIIRIEEVGDYNFVLPTNPNPPIQNVLANKVLEDVYIIIENIPVIEFDVLGIYLPKISTFNGAWNSKIHILNKIVTEFRFQATLNSYYDAETPANSDWIGAENQYSIGLGSCLLQIVDYNYWEEYAIVGRA
jgi:hypothetical protein